MSRTVCTVQADNSLLASLLSAFLSGDPNARQELPKRIHKKLIRQAQHFTPAYLAEDAVQRMWELLLRSKPTSFEPHKISAKFYIKRLLLKAARDVQASMTPPGERTRAIRDENGIRIPRQYAKSLDTLAPIHDNADSAQLHEILGLSADPYQQINEELDAEAILAGVSLIAPEVSEVIRWMYENGEGPVEASKVFRFDRSKLYRAVQRVRSYFVFPLAV